MSRGRPKLGLGGVSAISLAIGIAVALAAPAAFAMMPGVSLTLIGGLGVGFAGMALGAAGLHLGLKARRDADDTRAAFRVMTGKIARLEVQMAHLAHTTAQIAAQPRPASVEPVQTDVPAALKNTISELTAEIGLLGGLMRDIAETVSVHDRALDDLAQKQAAPAKIETRPASPPSRSATSRSGSEQLSVPDEARRLAEITAPRRIVPEAPAPVAANKAPASRTPAAAVTAAANAAPSPAAIVEDGRAPQPAPVVTAEIRERAARDEARADEIAEAAFDDRSELYLQPVVTLPQRRVKMYEVLGRIRLDEEQLLLPAEFLPVLHRRGLSAAFDERTVRRAFIVARHLAGRGSDAQICCNLSPASLVAPGFLRSLARAVAEHDDVAQRLVLELPQQAMRQLDAERLGGLAELAALGVGFTLDHVVDFRFDPPSLADRGVRFIKMPARLLLGVDAQRTDIDIGDLSALLARAGIALVAEHIESEDMVRDVLDLDVPLAQGFLFAVPRPVRPEVFQALPVPAAGAEAPAMADVAGLEAATAPERRPFRSFLKRAATA